MDSYEIESKQGEVEYAGFWIRFGASIIDGFVLAPITILMIYNFTSIKSLGLAILIVLAMAIYKPLMEFKYGATVGKRAVKIRVVNLNYGPIAFNQSITRYSPWIVAHFLNIISLFAIFGHPNFIHVQSFIEYSTFSEEAAGSYELLGSILLMVVGIIIVFDTQKRGGHDMFAKTYCIHV